MHPIGWMMSLATLSGTALMAQAENCLNAHIAPVERSPGETLRYCVQDGWALLGDEVIGDAEQIRRYGLPGHYARRSTSLRGQRLPRELSEGETPLTPEHFGFTAGLPALWPGNIVFYSYASDTLPVVRQAFERAIALYEQHTAVRFVPRTDEATYLDVRNFDPTGKAICGFGMIGYHAGPQILAIQSVPDQYCYGTEVAAMHEIFHALGFSHYGLSWLEPNFSQYEWLSSQLDPRNIQAINLAYPGRQLKTQARRHAGQCLQANGADRAPTLAPCLATRVNAQRWLLGKHQSIESQAYRGYCLSTWPATDFAHKYDLRLAACDRTNPLQQWQQSEGRWLNRAHPDMAYLSVHYNGELMRYRHVPHADWQHWQPF